eukprot:scaffold8234_cov248-Pinguiococcus_pyrenoidosus.AAC.1
MSQTGWPPRIRLRAFRVGCQAESEMQGAHRLLTAFRPKRKGRDEQIAAAPTDAQYASTEAG